MATSAPSKRHQSGAADRGPGPRSAELRKIRLLITTARKPPSPMRKQSSGTSILDDAFWERLYRHFNEFELVELGCMIGLTMGEQSWLLLGTSSTIKSWRALRPRLPPGFEDANRLNATRAQTDYWAKAKPSNARQWKRIYAEETMYPGDALLARHGWPPAARIAFFPIGRDQETCRRITSRITSSGSPTSRRHCPGSHSGRAGNVSSSSAAPSFCFFNWHAAFGVLLLLFFTVVASALLLRFWEVEGPMRTGLQNGMLANIAASLAACCCSCSGSASRCQPNPGATLNSVQRP